MNIRIFLLSTLALLLCYINASLYVGPFTKLEHNIISKARIYKAKKEKQKQIQNLAIEAKKGNAYAQFNYAFTFLDKRNSEYSQEKAIFWFKESGDNGYLDGYHKIAYGLDNGVFGFDKNYDQDKQLVEKFYRIAVDKGLAKSQNNLAIFLSEKYKEHADIKEIQDLRLKSAEGGDRYGIYNLAHSYYYGDKEFEKDLSEALKWFKISYQKNHNVTSALITMAWIYEQKDGPQYDPEKAGALYLEAALQENMYAMKKIAFAFEKGKYGYPVDHKKALKWYTKIAENGDDWGQNKLGHNYLDKMKKAETVEEKKYNREKSIEWFEKSANQGNTDSLTQSLNIKSSDFADQYFKD